mmetsp:Transcript_4645/g.7584  ORF Transcript_4645/g.7584 Transcript_4645/m.7584 type:complete len:155 (-) Transcript_4645:135-599(-)|eukprot:CAMPEP_0175032444 /NCGR_PEP_ID=MMETSP0005-20121125/21419_1 /TAXON_ID=420556 /ORGANISM="Ochromonas sp., Strain CCMP1393" /LENGTH=154 /DNA_ID=CAMNT_0016292895 /DNA_START=135 /DNA_END=599 /DNA_ORIENTATION=-
MTVYCVAFIGKFNEPLYFYSKEETSEYLRLQMIVHSCLDVIEERKKKAMTSTTAFDMYLGQLFPVDDYRTYGCYSNTHNKTIVICGNNNSSSGGFSDGSGGSNSTIKQLILALNSAFVGAIQNPFQPVGAPIVASKHLDEVIHQIVQVYNKRQG